MNLFADTILINGGKPLRGTVEIRGAKNFVTKAQVAALLAGQPSVLRGVPSISDVDVVSDLLRMHGVGIEHLRQEGILKIDPSGMLAANISEINAYAGSSRIPILFCGPFLHQLGRAFIPHLGGCHIGDRPIDFHLNALASFGAVVQKQDGGMLLTAPRGLHGAKIALPYPSVGATEQVLLTAVRARGTTELSGAAIEPEIMDLISLLQKMGAIISVGTNRTLRIEGVDLLVGYDHTGITDRSEAASWAAAALATGGDIFVRGAKQDSLLTFLNVFRKAGGRFEVLDTGIRFYHPGDHLSAVVVETDVHPGFMTDWQQPLAVALTAAHGTSIIHETVYEKRFGFVKSLNKMGASIDIRRECLGKVKCRFGEKNHEHSAVIVGPKKLHAADIHVPDLRGGFSHLIAALCAHGRSRVSNVGLISRGYEGFLEKLIALGADLEILE